jgi:hypothetical protein
VTLESHKGKESVRSSVFWFAVCKPRKSAETSPVRRTRICIVSGCQWNNGPLAIPAAVSQASSVCFTQVGTGTVRMCLPLPTRSTIAQRSSRRCMLSNVNSASSRRRRPQPSKIAKMARLRFPVSVCPSGSCQRVDASPAVNSCPNGIQVCEHLSRAGCLQPIQGLTGRSRQPQMPVAVQRPYAR